MKIKAFVGHSFTESDESVVRKILEMLNSIKLIMNDFDWVHAKEPSADEVNDKVRELFSGCNVFIGICTLKERVVEEKSLKRGFFYSDRLYSHNSNFKAKTSDWILQEIGYAAGKEMEVIILLEEGVKPPSGITGNLEYILFNRNSPEKMQTDLIKMIASIKGLQLRTASNINELPEELDHKHQSDQEDDLSEGASETKPMAEWEEKDLFFAVFKAKDRDEELRIFEDIKKMAGYDQKFKPLDVEVWMIHVKSIKRKEDIIPDLLEFERNHPENISCLDCLLSSYENSNQTDSAIKILKKLIQLSSGYEKIQYQYDLILKLAKREERESANKELLVLKKMVNGDDPKEYKVVLKANAKYHKELGSKIDFCLFAEALLEVDTEDNDIRFDLAYVYDELKLHELSVHHYKILTLKNASDSYFNNLGVAYSNLGIEGLSATSYEKSLSLGGTLAASNIANKYIKEGFYEKAIEICQEAIKDKNYHQNIPFFLNEAIRLKSSEAEDEIRVLQKAFDYQKFFLMFIESTKHQPPQEGTYNFIGNGKSVEVKISSNNIIVTSNEIKESSGLTKLFNSEKKTDVISIEYLGVLQGMSAKWTKKTNSQLLLGYGNEDGLLVFYDEMLELHMFSISEKKLVSFKLHK